ncbi:M43 family zinc metalloprotease [Dyadobacter helix]|nr:M43 family zinc metalloprotease [Dyadobacter sp. CECT 9275]
MKNLSRNILLGLICLSVTTVNAVAQTDTATVIRCAAAHSDSIKLVRNPSLRQLGIRSEQMIQEYLHRKGAGLRTATIEEVTIPVVVHVLHNSPNAGDQAGTGRANDPNIPLEQIQSQIDVLNEDYANASGYKGFYTDSLAVDTKIRFRLVKVVRAYTPIAEFNALTDGPKVAAASPPWPTDRYLNIWTCQFSAGYLGTSQFPLVTEITPETQGLSTSQERDNALTDGVIIDYRYFGRNAASVTNSLYDIGRTTTHEVGHWLGLKHIWGDGNCASDFCDDTPVAQSWNKATDLACRPVFSRCEGFLSRNMTENYMDYSPDRCMSIFTADQTARMHAVLVLSPRRAKLVENTRRTDKNILVNIYPNPVDKVLSADIYTPDFQSFSVDVFNVRGVKMVSGITNWAQINVMDYPSGLYFLRVTTDNESVTKRFLIR